MGVKADPILDGTSINLASNTDLVAAAKGPCRAIWVGVAGDVAITTLGGTDLTFTVAAGLFPVGASVIKSTANGTTATGIIALY